MRIVEVCATSAAKSVTADLDIERDVSTARKRVRSAIGSYLDKLADNAITLANPCAHAITVAGVRITGVGVALQYRAVSIEYKHVILEWSFRHFYQPSAGDVGDVTLGRRRAAARKQRCTYCKNRQSPEVRISEHFGAPELV